MSSDPYGFAAEEQYVFAMVFTKVFQGNPTKVGLARHATQVALKAIRDFEPPTAAGTDVRDEPPSEAPLLPEAPEPQERAEVVWVRCSCGHKKGEHAFGTGKCFPDKIPGGAHCDCRFYQRVSVPEGEYETQQGMGWPPQ